MKKQVHPLVAIVLIAALLAGVWYCYTVVYSGKIVLDHRAVPMPTGPAAPGLMQGPPGSGAKAPPAPGHGKPAAPSAAKATK